MRVVIALSLAASFAGSQAFAGEYVVNGNFDENLAGWQHTSSDVTWSATDSDGSPASGSMRFDVSSGIVAQQCISSVTGGLYGESFDGKIDPETFGDAYIAGYLTAYSTSGCTGAPLQEAWTFIQEESATFEPASVYLNAPGATHSVGVAFVVMPTNEAIAFVDSVSVGKVADSIFENGFEQP